jgi:hypothetical protein
MKTAIMHFNRYLSQPAVQLPNAATRREILQKVLDRMLIAASSIGIMAIFLFFLCLYI